MKTIQENTTSKYNSDDDFDFDSSPPAKPQEKSDPKNSEKKSKTKLIAVSSILIVLSVTALYFFLRNNSSNDNKENNTEEVKIQTHTEPVETTSLEQKNAFIAKEEVGEFVLIFGGCHEDGCTFEFMNSKKEKLYSSSVPDNILKYDNTDEGGTAVKEEFLNKTYRVTYKMKKVHHEASNSENIEMVIIKINPIK